MAGTITVTQALVTQGLSGVFVVPPNLRSVVKTSIAWVSDAAGAVSGNTLTMPAGSIIVVEFVPDSGGTQPTDLYDVTFTDPEGVNMFDDGAGASIGANLSNTTASHKVPFIGGGSVTYVRHWMQGGLYTPVVAAAGNAKGGTITIYQSLDIL